ncbi:protein CBFA2T1-like isoform X1 [Limulus polyphemus]|uniref:Protein CBFA2T1-like isoform X1 n=1 Tax=Limulus polyphemus TaxID=6850 RepID=A0ABM1TFC1_LIMPO|nr:protein CBFA2T1-like isoform X1 [Limulus polyphemus]
MPDSPDSNTKVATSSRYLAGTIVNHKITPVNDMNGTLSPHTSTGGGTPSPPILTLPSNLPTPTTAPVVNQGDTVSSGVRQLSKLKRFLTTLQQFGSDISPDVGERVHNLILGLVNSSITIEEFHRKIQDVTNYPLRSFVIPFLKFHLPLLQTELAQFARHAQQTPQQYLRQHENSLLDAPVSSNGEPLEIFQTETKEIGKRRSPSDVRSSENGYSDRISESPPPAKRHQPSPSPTMGSRVSPGVTKNNIHPNINFRFDEPGNMYRTRERDRYERYEREFHRPYNGTLPRDFTEDREMEEEWKNIHTMLNCILGMVEKTKSALAILHQRSQTDRSDYNLWGRRHLDSSDFELKKQTSDIMIHYKSAEERVSEVRRRAEEAVNEVKRQAVAELQKAVSAAETKASELVATERAKMEKLIEEAKRQATEEALCKANKQEDCTENCWNCGRKANETCSGCNVARYCGSFCQHKDWENHHRMCGQGSSLATVTSEISHVTQVTTSISTISSTTPISSGKRSRSPTVVSEM